MKLIYIDDYKTDEESTLRALGIDCIRLSKEAMISDDRFVELGRSEKHEIRGPRLTIAEYRSIWESAASSRVFLGTSPRSYEIGASFAEQYALLRDMSPGALVIDGCYSDGDILNALTERGLRFPLFLRSEIESAAKYVGVDGCIVTTPTMEAVATPVGNLRTHVQGFSSLIFKEVVAIAKDPGSGKRLEYRAIGMGGRLLTFDFDAERDKLTDPEGVGLARFANRALAALASGGADGGLFIDVAVTASAAPIVVECKNLLNGTIASVRRFGEALLSEGKAEGSGIAG